MSVAVDGDVIRLDGRCRLEEAETLLDALLRIERPQIDMTRCSALHTAVLQILLASRAPVLGPPDHPFLARHVWPLLAGRAPASVAAPSSL